jgi:hypothetical protein
MPVWSTYRLSDFLMFSPRTYERLVATYNRDHWPLHLVAVAIGVAILYFLWRSKQRRAVMTMVAACWVWVAWAFLWKQYATILWAAKYFAVLFLVEAVLVLWSAFRGDRSRFRARTGVFMFGFALCIEPLVAPLGGTFGMMPDPTIVGTMGIVLCDRGKQRAALLVIPLLWCAISGATLWAMHAPEALVLPVAGAVAVALAAWPLIRASRRARALLSNQASRPRGSRGNPQRGPRSNSTERCRG